MQCPHCFTDFHVGGWVDFSTDSGVTKDNTVSVQYLGRHHYYHHWVGAVLCPACLQVVIFLYRCGRVQSYSGSPTTPVRPLHAAEVSSHIVFPNNHTIPQTAARKEIDLQGVPVRLQTTYRKALQALDNPDLYGYANVLARRALEFTLKDKGFNGRDLAAQVDSLMSHPEGVPSTILDNIDAVRILGNWESHWLDLNDEEYIEPAKELTEWNVELLEWFLDHFYVKPARAKLNRDKINETASQAGRQSMKQPSR